jgi:hypothetical protein
MVFHWKCQIGGAPGLRFTVSFIVRRRSKVQRVEETASGWARDPAAQGYLMMAVVPVARLLTSAPL